MRSHQNNLLLIEMVIVLLFFALSQAVVLQVFTKAQQINRNAEIADHARFTFPYEAVLSESPLRANDKLPTAYRWIIRKSLTPNPDDRPEDGLLQRFFSPPGMRYIPCGLPINSLSRFLLPDCAKS